MDIPLAVGVDEHTSGNVSNAALCEFILKALLFAFKTYAPKIPEMDRFCVC